MELETKRDLLKWTDSYWDMLPTEMKDLILEYRESQELLIDVKVPRIVLYVDKSECTNCCDKGGK